MTGVESVKSNDFMRRPLRVLMVEDSVNDTLLTAAALQSGGLEPVFERVETAASMQAALDVQEWDLVICDYSMPHFTGAAQGTARARTNRNRFSLPGLPDRILQRRDHRPDTGGRRSELERGRGASVRLLRRRDDRAFDFRPGSTLPP